MNFAPTEKGNAMMVDIGEVKKHIKPKADSTLYNMRKVDLIEYIRTLEHNYNVAVSFNENQARYIESLDIAGIVRCKDCKHCCLDLSGRENHLCMRKEVGFVVRRKANDFCSYGERKGNE